jgi:glycosyltransferase involved in cell wall biosynthesis
MSGPTLLLMIPQTPFDSASGAAISERTTCEMLARAGWHVEVVAPTASESHTPLDTARVLESMGVQAVIDRSLVPSCRPVFCFSRRSVSYRLLDTGMESVSESRKLFISDLDALANVSLASSGTPDIFLTYGSSEAEVRRRSILQQAGTSVVFSAHHTAYRHPRAFEGVDAIVACSRFVADYYHFTHGVDPTPLPVPIYMDDVVSRRSQPTFFTFVNPELRKGVAFFLRLVSECSLRWPELPFLVLEGRGSGQLVAKVAELLNLDILAMKNLHLAVNNSVASSIYAVTKVLLVPSLFEAAGRVAVEAELNGLPVIASDREGLPETVGAGGFILPVAADVDSSEGRRATAQWTDLIGRFHTDPAFYQQARCSALSAALGHASGEVERQRIAYFSAVAGKGAACKCRSKLPLL